MSLADFDYFFDSLLERPTLWEALQTSSLPLVLYGTGDGADKILAELSRRDLQVSAIFVSDDFYRGQSFHQMPVSTLAQVESRFSSFQILLAFGSHLPDILARVKNIAGTHPLFVPDVPVCGDALFDRQFALRHREELKAAYRLLADDASRQVFQDVLQYKLSGELPPLLACTSPAADAMNLLALGPEENYLDLGAYRGDTIDAFLATTGGRYRSITALEPDRRSFRKLLEHMAEKPHVRLLPYGVSSQNGYVDMLGGRGRGSHLADSPQAQQDAAKVLTPVTTVDALSLPASYIKMDVEGSEATALQGAAETIRRCHPKLQIACYHRSEDLFALPLLIHALEPTYQIYLRRHPCLPCWDLNLYCI